VTPANKEKEEVLNAFRHQRGKQRIMDMVTRRPQGAQRLSASEGKTDAVVLRCAGGKVVLNAFRHQRGKQPPFIIIYI